MTVSLEEQIRQLALVASAENEDEVSDALLLVIRGRQLPRAARRGFVNAIGGLLAAAEICQSISIRARAASESFVIN